MAEYNTTQQRSIMATMSEEEKTAYRKRKLDEILTHHADLIRDLGINTSDFNMKMPFHDDMGNLVVGIFASEFRKSKGFYFEMIDNNLNPVNPRKVFRIPPNPNYQEEYKMNSKGSYLVPMEEIREVNIPSVAISKFSAISNLSAAKPAANYKSSYAEIAHKAPGLLEDVPYAEMTLRDYYAIVSGKPVSKRQWLNELIKK